MVSKVNDGTKNVLLTTILYFQIHNENKTTLVAVLIHQTTLGKELITCALCAQVIRLYSGGLMTQNRNSGGFLLVFKHLFRRKASKEEVMKGVKEAIEMRHKHADIVAGFDLVGREDQGNSLLYYIDALLYPAKAGIHLPFFFHAGETGIHYCVHKDEFLL